MIYHFDDLKDGYTVDADVVIVGSGAGGAMAASNFVEAGFKTVLVEAGQQIRLEDMTRDAPKFLAKHFWEGGLRMLIGNGIIPSMQGRALGGSTISNSAIMFRLPQWVRNEWIEEHGLSQLKDEAFDASFDRIFKQMKVAPTPMAVQGPRNLAIRDALESMGIESGPLPRAVQGCEGAADCLIGCASGAKVSVDRAYLEDAVKNGLTIYTCSEVERILMDGTRATGIEGHVVDNSDWQRHGKFRVNAPRVIVAGGALQSPVLLQKSGIKHRGAVGGTLKAHLSGGVFATMDRPMHPWVGATQGWGAISKDIQGMKFESLWADPSTLLVKWGGFGADFLQQLTDVERITVGAVVYRGACSGSVRAQPNGMPLPTFWISKEGAQTTFRGMKILADGLFKTGAESVYVGRLPGTDGFLRSKEETSALLSPKLRGQHLPMTGNHIFCSVRMTADEKTPVDLDGKVRGVEGVWVADASILPTQTAVNPQATIMALADIVTRKAADLSLT